MAGGKRIVILGAGTSGLAVGWGLLRHHWPEAMILEADSRVGGLAKTVEHDGIRFDIGPHRLSPQLPDVVELLKEVMGPGALVAKKNIHGVFFRGTLYRYPPSFKDFLNPRSLAHTWVFGTSWCAAQIAACLRRLWPHRGPVAFQQVLLDNFGRQFCQAVIFPMVRKVWGTNDLHAEFARIRFIKPTLGRMLLKIIFRRLPAANSIFHYPVKGYGEICEALARHLEAGGIRVELHARITAIRAESLKGPFTIFYTQNGAARTVEADTLVSTISNRILIEYLAQTGLVEPLRSSQAHFVSRTLRLGVLAIKDFTLPCRVVIFPEGHFIFNRISQMNQFADLGYPHKEAILLVDVICDAGSQRERMGEEEFTSHLLESVFGLGWFRPAQLSRAFSLRFPEAYPVLDERRHTAQEAVDRYFSGSNVILCGREASSDYNNTHNALSKGLFTAQYLAGELSPQEYARGSRLIGRLPIQD